MTLQQTIEKIESLQNFRDTTVAPLAFDGLQEPIKFQKMVSNTLVHGEALFIAIQKFDTKLNIQIDDWGEYYLNIGYYSQYYLRQYDFAPIFTILIKEEKS